MPKFQLENNPLFSDADIKIIKEESKDPTLDLFTRMTFIVRKDLLDKLRDYAYTERLDMKQAINEALECFLADKTDLLKAPEKPKQVHKRG